MQVRDARELARHWVVQHAAQLPGFRGALLHGSIHARGDEEELPASSDVDVWIVLDDPSVLEPRGKRSFEGLVLDIGVGSSDSCATPEKVLADFRLAGTFAARGAILAGVGDWLSSLHETVAREFPRRHWVERRCEAALAVCVGYVDSLSSSQPPHEQALCWVFGAGVTNPLLAAALWNPTVRKRYVALRSLLAEHGRLDFHESVLGLLGSRAMGVDDVLRHLASMERAFDAAAAVASPGAPHATDICDLARPITIEGSRELVREGLHREAMFWVVVSYARSMARLSGAGVAVSAAIGEPFDALLEDLGLGSFDAVLRRAEEVRSFLPRVRELAVELMPTEGE